MVHVELAAGLGGLLHGLLGLALAADEKDALLLCGEIAEEIGRHFDLAERFLEVDDVDAVPFFEDEPLHSGMPAAGLVSEMDSGFDEFSELLVGHGVGFAWLPHGVPSGSPLNRDD